MPRASSAVHCTHLQGWGVLQTEHHQLLSDRARLGQESLELMGSSPNVWTSAVWDYQTVKTVWKTYLGNMVSGWAGKYWLWGVNCLGKKCVWRGVETIGSHCFFFVICSDVRCFQTESKAAKGSRSISTAAPFYSFSLTFALKVYLFSCGYGRRLVCWALPVPVNLPVASKPTEQKPNDSIAHCSLRGTVGEINLLLVAHTEIRQKLM